MHIYTTVGGWAVVITAAGIYYYISRRTSAKAPRTKVTTRQTKVVEKHEKQKPIKAKKAPKSGAQSSGGEQDVNRIEKSKKKEKEPGPPSYQAVTLGAPDRDDEVDNKEFARQLSSAKSSTLLPSKTQEGGRQKSVKQSKAQEKAAVHETSSDITAPSSAAGGDADDDRSSFNSPELGATSIDDAPVTNGGISDMLEAPAPGPSILKITSPTNPAQPKKSKAPAAFEPAETKKQRQNRKKAEQKKAAREEEEKERKVLAEKQRRTAREAEGRAAKDGSTFTAAKAPVSSVWTAPPSTTSESETAAKPKVELLDTFEPESRKESTSESDWQKVAASMSEEEQIRQLEEDHWEPVQGKKSKRKGKGTESTPQEKQEKQASAPKEDDQDYGPPKVIAPTKAGQKWKMTLEKTLPNGETVEYDKEVQDSEWDVAGYGDA